ncbi:glycogen-debranching protein [Roseiconus nitratireducens]|uniref:Glycogen-debranching protein n=1 Tax=Roseiconus nitratireducens TaxID=2605748 RepID=A0A5M6D8V2_9BACT|nr:isoamylase [Roseiconus nitratireducens]KAA5543056.1 glycogen-debranching protein [Roseiconus nitratireducens]
MSAPNTPESESARPSWKSREGAAHPLGVSFDPNDGQFNFAIYSKHAESVTIEFYRTDNLIEPFLSVGFDHLSYKSGPVWHRRIPADQIDGPCVYAYRISGPAPAGGFEFHAFDPEKLLLDPYAHTVYFPPEFSRAAACQPGSNAGKSPLAYLAPLDCDFDWRQDRKPVHDADLLIYEVHVRGFTQNANSGVAADRRGTFLGLCDKIPYLKELGVTAVELMPVFQFDSQENNYWGYMPMNVFSPHHEYATRPDACEHRNEFREMVRQLHAADIEVILDVVYNHTCEGDDNGPTYSMKGIDNSTYYVASHDPAHPYSNFSGTGNTLHTANRTVRRLIIDSMRYWVQEMHVDGFRFDLASVFTRNSDGSINLEDPPIFGQIGSEDELSDIRLIAEPWDAAGVYQLGRSFPGMQWMQWNASFRDTVQRFVRGDRGQIPDLMTRLYGSSDLFPDDRFFAYRPWQSVNYVASHDGMTMADLVSFQSKNNWANGHQNTDGNADFCSNHGWEGNVDVPARIAARRKQKMKNYFCLILLSNGTPMFRMGDEFMQTQGGNNNPYNQDNETSWLDWSLLAPHQDLFQFVKAMIAFRKQHPSISRSRFWRDDVTWYGTDRLVDLSASAQCIAYCLHGRTESDDDLYVMINGSEQEQVFGIHEGLPGQWKRVIDTSRRSPQDLTALEDAPACDSRRMAVSGESVVVMVRPRRE